MRQIGILCAAALVAVHENVAKLESDHKKAKLLAGTFHAILPAQCSHIFLILINYFFSSISEGLNEIKGLKVDVRSVETNIVSIS